MLSSLHPAAETNPAFSTLDRAQRVNEDRNESVLSEIVLFKLFPGHELPFHDEGRNLALKEMSRESWLIGKQGSDVRAVSA